MAHGLWATTDFVPLSFQYSKNSALEKATLIAPGRAYRHSEKEDSACPVKLNPETNLLLTRSTAHSFQWTIKKGAIRLPQSPQTMA
ncbi:hypothetical protein BK797_19360 [Kosakonia sacchari]|nr:hypothetical protein BK797_19360 [Kosakonia sacchari]